METKRRPKPVTAIMIVALAAVALFPPVAAAAQAVPNLGQDSLKILVTGVALYPDGLLAQILPASAHPLQIRAAAEGGAVPAQGPLARIRGRAAAAAGSDPSLEALKAYPDILTALNANLAMTFRLGLAYQNQPNDVWAAIRAVRAEVESTLRAAPAPQPAAPTAMGPTTVVVTQPAPAPYPYPNYAAASAAVLTGMMLNAYAVNELAQAVQTTSTGAGTTTIYNTSTTTTTPATGGTTATTTTAGGAQTTTTSGGTATTASGATVTGGTRATSGSYTTPSGGTVTASGQGAGVAVQGQSGAAIAGGGTKTVTGPGGTTATATGAGAAGAYTAGNTTYAGAAGAGTMTASTGQSVSGAGYAKGAVTQEGSTTSWNTQAAGAVQNNTTGATAAAAHSGSGSVNTATGTGSYAGSTDVKTPSGGTVGTDTTLGYAKGEGVSGSTTVTKADGSTATKSYGDAQPPAAQGASSAQRTTGGQPQAAAPWQAQARDGKYGSNDLAAASQAHQQSWNSLNQAFAKPKPSAPSHHPSKRGRRG